MTHRFYARWIIGGIVVLLIVAGACYLWYQHDTAPDRKAAADAKKLLRQSEKSKKVSKTGNKVGQATDVTPAESSTPTAEKQRTNTTLVTDKTEPSPAKNPTQNAETETEVRVSPYGFGPYPEVPQGFIDAIGKPFWLLPDELLSRRRKPPSRNVELMQRVMVKLWKQGRTDVQAAFMDGERVRVHFKNHAYVRYSTFTAFNGEEVRYISSWRSGSDIPAPKRDPSDPFDTSNRNIPPGVELIDMDKDPGIDPYEFLGLN